ncbi:hypothetical protein L1987_38104 [Smallanthus sonchifolius]|uniref:Uncharacterized protein n=1 Tax=Smallanthus sonchifolius TaxID=185202 RepID=A0ACB9HI24_9ASTR|nr:hypothetical protein L1987_38104 [Smallanthus sonchifolius]
MPPGGLSHATLLLHSNSHFENRVVGDDYHFHNQSSSGSYHVVGMVEFRIRVEVVVGFELSLVGFVVGWETEDLEMVELVDSDSHLD